MGRLWPGPAGGAGSLAPVAAEVVYDYDVAGLQGRGEHLLDIEEGGLVAPWGRPQ